MSFKTPRQRLRAARSARFAAGVRVHREILAAASRAGGEAEAHAALAWAVLRDADPAGTALLRFEHAVRAISVARAVKSRRARQILDEGDGRYWRLRGNPQTDDRLVSLAGAANVAAMLGVERLGLPAVVPMGRLRGRGAPRALAAAAPVATRREGRQLSRETIAKETGVPRAAQRRLEQRYQFSAVVRQVRRNVARYVRAEPGARFGRFDWEAIRLTRERPAHYLSGRGYVVHRESDVRRTAGIRLDRGSKAHRHINRKLRLLRSSTLPLPDHTDGGSGVVVAPARLVTTTMTST